MFTKKSDSLFQPTSINYNTMVPSKEPNIKIPSNMPSRTTPNPITSIIVNRRTPPSTIGLATPIPTTSIPITSIPITSIQTTSIPTTSIVSIPITSDTVTASTTPFFTTSVPITSVPSSSVPTTSVPSTSVPNTSSMVSIPVVLDNKTTPVPTINPITLPPNNINIFSPSSAPISSVYINNPNYGLESAQRININERLVNSVTIPSVAHPVCADIANKLNKSAYSYDVMSGNCYIPSDDNSIVNEYNSNVITVYKKT